MPELRQFDPLGTSQRARQNQLVIEGQEQGLAQSAIKQDQQQKLFGQQQQVFGQQQQTFQQGESLKRAKTMNQVATAMLKLPEEQWASAAQSLAPLLKQFGLPAMDNPANLSRSKFEEIVATTGAFVTDPSTIPTGKDFTLGQGQKRFDSAGNVIAEGGAKPPALTSLQKNAAALGLVAGTPEYNEFITKGATRPGTVISKGETAEEVALAKLGVQRFSDVQKAADGATKLLENLDQLSAIDVESGALEPAKATLAAIVEGFGIDASGIANATNAQAFNAVSGRLVNEVLNAATGPQTDQDATRARKTIASLGDTPGALVFKNASLRAVALRQIDQRDFINEQLDNGDTLRQANKEWRAFKNKTPSLSSVVKKDGLPMFFYQFKEAAKQRRAGISDEDIIKAWRGAHAK